METDLTNMDGKSKFQDASISPMHTTEHIVNQTMVRLFRGSRAVSAHIERKKSKLDFQLEQPLIDAEVKQLEQQVNNVIQMNLPVIVEYITREEASERFDLKRLPKQAPNTVRVVKIGDYDECLCAGLHVKNTSEIGTFKIISHDFREGVWRMRFKLQPPSTI